jgi:hypothetical protein
MRKVSEGSYQFFFESVDFIRSNFTHPGGADTTIRKKIFEHKIPQEMLNTAKLSRWMGIDGLRIDWGC